MRCPASGPDPNPAALGSRAGRRTGAGRNAAASVPAGSTGYRVRHAGRHGTLQALVAKEKTKQRIVCMRSSCPSAPMGTCALGMYT